MDNNSFTIRQNTVDQACNAWNIFMVPRPPAPVFSNILKYAKKTQLGRQLQVVVLFCFIQPTRELDLLANMQKPNLCLISFLPYLPYLNLFYSICNRKIGMVFHLQYRHANN